MDRRSFLKGALSGAAATALAPITHATATEKAKGLRPLFCCVLTDQHRCGTPDAWVERWQIVDEGAQTVLAFHRCQGCGAGWSAHDHWHSG